MPTDIRLNSQRNWGNVNGNVKIGNAKAVRSHDIPEKSESTACKNENKLGKAGK
jgi:hypothetical protein